MVPYKRTIHNDCGHEFNSIRAERIKKVLDGQHSHSQHAQMTLEWFDLSNERTFQNEPNVDKSAVSIYKMPITRNHMNFQHCSAV